jgi:drug/metabolite transporter (DMT)-like permease
MPAYEARAAPSLFLVLAGFAVVYLVWGSTYLAIRFAIETLPPFLMAGTRFLAAGFLLYPVAARRHSARLSWSNWRAAAVVGCLMLVGGNGLVCWAEQSVASGLAALIIATVPLWLVSLDWLLYRGPRPTPRIVIGLMTGLLGVYLLIGPERIGGQGIHLPGGVALLMAAGFWATGSLYSRRAKLPSSPFLATATEMIAGGAALVLIGTVAGEWSHVKIASVSAKSLAALVYLILFGSILALTAYMWLLRVTTSARVSTYAYVNPVVAMALGYAFADEPLTLRVVIAAAVILGAVALITTSKPPLRESDGATTASEAAERNESRRRQ